ncbi:MAG: hypothetical protein U1E65_14925 [Myxococcota bacterium]
MRIALFALLGLCAPSTAFAAGVFVNAGTLTSSITQELLAEGRTVAARPEDAEAIADLRLATDALEVVVRAKSGAVLAERAVSTADGLAPALRIAVLLISDAARPENLPAPPVRTSSVVVLPPSTPPPLSPAPTPTTTATAAPPAPAPGRLAAYVTAGIGLFSKPSAPSVSVALGGLMELGPLDLDVSLVLDGALCCALRLPERIEGSSFSLQLRGLLGLALFHEGPASASVLGGFAFGARQIRSTVLAFAATAPTETQLGVEGGFYLGLGLEWAIGGLGSSLMLRGGAAARFGTLTVALPAGYGEEGPAIDPGILSPWAEVGLIQNF